LAVVVAGDVAERKGLDIVVWQPSILCLFIILVITCVIYEAGALFVIKCKCARTNTAMTGGVLADACMN
jgi:hypothetical protein